MSSLEAVQTNIVIRRYRTFRRDFTFKNPDGTIADLSAYTITSQMRVDNDYGATLIGALNVDDTDKAIGEVSIYLSIAETGLLTPQTGYFDILFDNGVESESWIEGQVEIRQSITNQP